VTIHEIAHRLGVSTASVSYALNGRPGVSDATRDRVLALADELGWRPNSSARALSRSRSDTIGMVLRRDSDLLGTEPYYMSLLGGVEDVLSQAQQSLLLRMVGTADGNDVDVYRRWSGEGRVDGVIVLDLAVDDPRPALLRGLGLPFVLHGLRIDPDTGEQVVEDLASDAATIVRHLAELGHREILHVTGPLHLAHEVKRRDAVRAEAASHGIHADFVECDYTMRTAERMMRARAAHERATAVISSNDVMALGILTALREGGHTETSVVSWDDSMLCRISTPAMTALARHPDAQGRRSARTLLNLLDGIEPTPEPAMPSVLMARGSTRPPHTR